MTKKGLTLIELLLAISAITLLGMLSIPYFMTFQVSSQSKTASEEIAQSLRRARIKAITAEQDDDWGLSTKDGNITLFKGSNYANRDQNFDEVFLLPPTIAASGLNEIYFQKTTGLPPIAGTITITNTNSLQKNIIINANGTTNIQ